MKELDLILPFIGFVNDYDAIKDYDVIPHANSHQIRLICLGIRLTLQDNDKNGPPPITCLHM